MNWLGHHEFGKGQKPFLLSETPSFEQFSTHSLNYWLILWIRYYERILSTSFVTVVPYEDFLKEPANVLRSIGSDLGLEVKLESLTVFEKHPAVLPEYHQELADKAKELYHTLINHREKSITN
jgi:hypothetical protein